MKFSFKPVIQIIRLLSWTKIAQLTALLAIILSFWLMWVFRADMYSSLRMNSLSTATIITSIDMTKESKAYVTEIMNRSPELIAGIQIINVDFKRNVRSTSYFAISDVALKDAVTHYTLTKVSETPLFNENEVNNRRIIDLVNGEFICTNFKETLASKIYAGAQNNISVICSISIPPHYGKFSGYLNIYLKRFPDKNDFDAVRQMAREISEHVYTYDILTPKPLGAIGRR